MTRRAAAVQDGPDLFAASGVLTAPRAWRPAPAALPDPQDGPDLFADAADAPRRAGGCTLVLDPHPSDERRVRPRCTACGWGAVGWMGEDAATALFGDHADERATT